MSLDTLITNAFEEWVNGEVTFERVRQIDLGESADSLWRSFDEQGFADLLVGEEHGGAGASAETAGHMLMVAGAAALPLPLASTWWVRYALAEAGLTLPDGPITLADGRRNKDLIRCPRVPNAFTARWVLASLEDEAWLLPISASAHDPLVVHASHMRDLSWTQMPADAQRMPDNCDWRSLGAAFTAALIAGAAEKLLRLTVDYANTRQQFGKTIGSMQAIQQQISLLAEEVASTRMAAQLALRSDIWPSLIPAAVAKARCSAAAGRICAIAHAVTGAIGVSEEFDLQVLTRRLYEWRADYGSESFWYTQIGRVALKERGSSLDLSERYLPFS